MIRPMIQVKFKPYLMPSIFDLSRGPLFVSTGVARVPFQHTLVGREALETSNISEMLFSKAFSSNRGEETVWA